MVLNSPKFVSAMEVVVSNVGFKELDGFVGTLALVVVAGVDGSSSPSVVRPPVPIT